MHYYIMPITGTGTRIDPVRPKYILFGIEFGWIATYYRFRPVCLLKIDVDALRHAQIDANTDVFAFPDDLDSTLSSLHSSVNAVQHILNINDIPNSWVNAQLSHRDILQGVSKLFYFAQRYQGMAGPDVFSQSTNLNTPWQNIPDAVHDAIQVTAMSFDIDITALNLHGPLGTALYDIARNIHEDTNAPIGV